MQMYRIYFSPPPLSEQTFWGSSMSLWVPIVCFCLRLNGLPLYGCPPMCLFIHLLMGIRPPSPNPQFWALQTKLLWIFLSRSLPGHTLSFLLSQCLRAEWLGHVAGVCVTGEQTHLVAYFVFLRVWGWAFLSLMETYLCAIFHEQGTHMFCPLTE